MEIEQYTWNVLDSNSWLVSEDGNGLLIDVVDNPALYLAIDRLKTLTIILTHCHFDHICGLNRLREIRPEALVIATERCSKNIGNQFRNLSSCANAYLTFYEQGRKRDVQIDPFTCSSADSIFTEQLSFMWGIHHIELSAFNGHSEGGLIALMDDANLFSGDTILSIPTVTRFPGGSTKRFWEEDIPRLRNLGEKYVYPGHGSRGKLKNMLKQYQECRE